MRSALIGLLFVCLCAAPAAAQPVLSYDFNGGGAGPAVNAGTGGTPTMPLNGLTMTGVAPGGSFALAGDTTLSINGGDSGWVTNLPNGVTIAFCIDTSGHALVGGNAFSYLWGDNTATSFRCFTDGAAGSNNMLFRGGGLGDTLCPNSHGPQGWTHVAFVYDAAAGESRAYVNGSRVNTVAQTANVAIMGTGNFHVGGYTGSTDAMDTNQFMDDFMLFDSAMSDAQINSLALAASCLTQEYSINTPAATFTIDGAAGGLTSAGQVAVGSGTTVNVVADTNVASAPWELAWTLNPTVPASGGGNILGPGAGEILNLNLADPSLTYLNNFFGANWSGTPLNVAVALASGNYGGQFGIMDPATASGFNLSTGVDVAVVPCNGSNFDASSALPPGWSTPAGFSGWTVDAAGTPSTGTGPTAAVTPPNYLYCETSVVAGTMFAVDTCAVDFTGLTNFNLDFDLSRIGATVGTLDIYIDDGTGTFPTLIGSYTGPDPAQMQGGTEWSAESISLIPFLPATNAAAFRFQYVSGTSFTGDVALDNVSFN